MASLSMYVNSQLYSPVKGEYMAGVPQNDNNPTIPLWFPAAAFIIGVIFIIGIVVLLLENPSPTTQVFVVFRIIIALAGAAFTMAFTGFVAIRLDFAGRGYLIAGGSLGVFIILYFFSPASTFLPLPKRFPVCEDFYRDNDNSSLTTYLNNSNTRFTGTCKAVNYSSCLAFDERHDQWVDFVKDCPGAALYSIKRTDGTCCDTFAFKGEGFSGKSGYYCCY
jgi:hypothetical protein